MNNRRLTKEDVRTALVDHVINLALESGPGFRKTLVYYPLGGVYEVAVYLNGAEADYFATTYMGLAVDKFNSVEAPNA